MICLFLPNLVYFGPLNCENEVEEICNFQMDHFLTWMKM